MKITTVSLHFGADDDIEQVDTGAISIGGVWLIADTADDFERLVAGGITATNLMRGAE